MWNANESQRQTGGDATGIIAVAVNKDKGSQHALKWAVDNLAAVSNSRSNNSILKLVHVHQRSPSSDSAVRRNHNSRLNQREPDTNIMEILLPFRCFCTRRQVQFEIDILEDHDVAHALIEYVSYYGVETLLLGASSKTGLSRLFKTSEVASSVLKHTPDYCNVYVISKGKVNTQRNASRPIPPHHLAHQPETTDIASSTGVGLESNNYDEMSVPEILDMPLESSARPSTDSTCLSFYHSFESSSSATTAIPTFPSPPSNLLDINDTYSSSSNLELPSHHPNSESLPDFDSLRELTSLSSISLDQEGTSLVLSQKIDETEHKMKRLKMEVKQTMEMYHAACKEALQAKQKVMELQQWKMKEEKRLQEAQLAEETAMAVMEKEKAKCKAANEAAEASQRVAEREIQRRVEAESKALREAEEKCEVLDALSHSHMVLKYQSLYHILAVLFLFYFYFSIF
ncbi:U-box domain-containing protein 51 [Ziziphus jujuba]|uniref:RING-type E3 ubiquitin transferase n=1 Tax=Ziziphus jujuba TaxID=326968 RepID=A0A6P6G5D1_ZIZJJ|nr:U-box domain-containing protein 51 [Ziziphus jujuba]